MPARKRLKVLFVDDDPHVHSYEYALSKKLGLRAKHAYSPEEARDFIAFRLKVIRRLAASKQARLAKEKDAYKRKKLGLQIAALKTMRWQPFDLVVSDINMPIGVPTGMPFVRKIRKGLPKQKILMHSDDLENLEVLEEELALESAYKAYPFSLARRHLEKGLRETLRKKKKSN